MEELPADVSVGPSAEQSAISSKPSTSKEAGAEDEEDKVEESKGLSKALLVSVCNGWALGLVLDRFHDCSGCT